MNIVLFDQSELDQPLARTDERAQHILRVLRRDVGDELDVGLLNGPRGKAKVTAIAAAAVQLAFDWAPPHPAPPPTILIIGLPRPQTARDILRDATTLGATALHFVATARSDPNYATSSLWQKDAWRRHVIAGAAQAFDTHLPEVTWHHDLATALQKTPAGASLLSLDNYGADTPLHATKLSAANGPVVLCLGPERGWDDRDRAILAEQGAQRRHLGDRVLRLETAVTAAMTLLNATRATAAD